MKTITRKLVVNDLPHSIRYQGKRYVLDVAPWFKNNKVYIVLTYQQSDEYTYLLSVEARTEHSAVNKMLRKLTDMNVL